MRKWFPILATLALVAGTAFVQATEHQHFGDANLYAIQFVGDGEGWACGDEGVILHTIDGGKNWERVSSGTRGSLKSICFITPQFGWIVGREELPKGGSAGVILFTADGGINWNRVLANSLPGLNRVRFVDAKTGFLLGDGTDVLPSGVFKTTDGGKSWAPVAGPRATTWYDGDFVDGELGALGGAWSRLAKMRQGTLTAADVDTLGGRSVRGLRLMQERALAIGDGGLMLLSKSQGAGWGYADLKLPVDILANLDFHAVDCVGNRVWVVGRPGSVVFHSKDGGLNWEMQKTSQTLPLYGVYFRDEDNGCAVGALGTVVLTSDGGKTWKVARQGGQRAATMCVHADGGKVPLETITQLGLEEGFLVTGLRVCSADPKSGILSKATEEMRFSSAMRLAGGVMGESLWQFPLPQHLGAANKKQLVEHWDNSHGKQSAQQMLRQMVLAIRTWKPDVILTDNPDSSVSETQVGSLVAEAVHEAVRMAADPQAFPEQLQKLELKTWKVAKVYSLWHKRQTSHVSIDATEVKNRLLTTLRHFSHPAAVLLGSDNETLAHRFYRLLDSQIAGAENQNQLMAGVNAATGTGARRKLAPETEPDAAVVKAAQASQKLQLLAENPVQGLATPDQIISQLKPVLSKLPHDQGAAAAFALANQYVRSGQWLLAQETFLMMADQYPAHPLTAQAYRWLILHNTSSEAKRRYELGQFVLTGQMGMTSPKMPSQEQVEKLLEMKKKQNKEAPPFLQPKGTGPGKEPVGGEPKQLPENFKNLDLPNLYQGTKVSQQAQITYLSNQADQARWYKSSKDFAERLQLFGPIHARDPHVNFCLQAAQRNMGDFKTSHDWYKHQKNVLPFGPWQKAAAAEYWLAFPDQKPPKPILQCPRVQTRPYLDGDLSDACWQEIKPVVLSDAVEKTTKDYTTEIRLAHDQDFLYVALSCTHPPEFHVPPVKARPRDGDLRSYDRVSLLLDLDRDYSTYFHLQVDQRGCVFEDCWGDRSWNPKWFVAVRSNKTSWTIEAAIPLSQLTGKAITTGEAWACNVVRILPQRGVQAFSLPADVEPQPEGMGLLLFQQPPQKNIQPVSHIMPTVP